MSTILHDRFLFVISTVTFLLFSVAGWFSIEYAEIFPTWAQWVIPFLLFSVAIIGFALMVVSTRNRLSIFGMIVVSLGASIILGASVLSVILLLISCALSFFTVELWWREMDDRVSFNLAKSMRLSITPLLFAYSLVASGLFYARIADDPIEQIVPRMRMSQNTGIAIALVMENVHPGFRKMADDSTTVDEFLRGFQETNPSLAVELSPGQKNLNAQGMPGTLSAENLFIANTRKNLSQSLGVPLSGDEQVIAVLENAVNQKVRTLLVPASGDTSVFPTFLTIVMFFTIYPLASLLKGPWSILAAGIFILAKKAGLVDVVAVPSEVFRIQNVGDKQTSENG